MSDRSRVLCGVSSFGRSRKLPAYIDPVVDQLGPLAAADIETVFRKAAGRLGRDRVRKRLCAKGFPHPFERGLWSVKAVADWLASAGSAERMSRTSQRRATDSLCPFSLWIAAEQP